MCVSLILSEQRFQLYSMHKPRKLIFDNRCVWSSCSVERIDGRPAVVEMLAAILPFATQNVAVDSFRWLPISRANSSVQHNASMWNARNSRGRTMWCKIWKRQTAMTQHRTQICRTKCETSNVCRCHWVPRNVDSFSLVSNDFNRLNSREVRTKCKFRFRRNGCVFTFCFSLSANRHFTMWTASPRRIKIRNNCTEHEILIFFS